MAPLVLGRLQDQFLKHELRRPDCPPVRVAQAVEDLHSVIGPSLLSAGAVCFCDCRLSPELGGMVCCTNWGRCWCDWYWE